MVETTTKTKTMVAVALTVLSIGSMVAGLYYYGARVKKSANQTATSQKSSSTTGAADTAAKKDSSAQTVAVIGGDSSVKYGLAPINISQHGKVDVDSTTLDSWCEKAGFDGATGLLTIGVQAIPDTAKSTAMLVASGEKIVEKIDSLGAKTYSTFGNYLKSCELGSNCQAQCYAGGKTIGTVTLARVKTSVNDYCKEKGYEGATGVVSSMGNKYISQISSPAGGAEFDPASVGYDRVYWCAYASQVCFAQCYK